MVSMKNNENTFYMQLKDLPENTQQEVKRLVDAATIPIIVDETPIGSGTLVKIDDVYGILTAQHVVKVLGRPELHLDYTGHPERHLCTVVADFPHSLKISTNALSIYLLDPSVTKYGPFGPDLAFIRLPNSCGFLAELKARRYFTNLAHNTEKKKEIGCNEYGFFCFCGFPRQRDATGPAGMGFSETTVLSGGPFFTGPVKYTRYGNHDYYDLGITKATIDGFLDSFGGVSGGGLWKFPIYQKNGIQLGDKLNEDIVFAGVAFYEEKTSDGDYTVRAHGPVSIYDTFLAELRRQISGTCDT